MRDILGYENALMSSMADQDLFREFLERAVDYNLALAGRAVREFGIEIVSTTDDVATNHGMLIRPEVYFDVIGPSFQRVIQGYKDLGLKVIKHCDGDCSAVIDFWIEAGIDCLDPIDPGAGFDMADFKARYGDRICLKGNIDCKGALQYGTPLEVEAEVRTCIEKGGAGGGLILSSSNTIHRGVKPENYRAMLAALKQFGRSTH
jgi:uroporphyrinogen decarboxylase